MQRVSSNYTIIFKLFLPTIWLVFFGLFMVASLFIDVEFNPFFNTLKFKLGLILFYLVGAVFLYFTFLKLKRVDFGKDRFYISNYFKTYKYDYKDIKSVKRNNYGVIKTVNIILRSKGSFGKKISFVPQSKFLMTFIREHAEHFKHLEEKFWRDD